MARSSTRPLLVRAYRDGWIKERKLHMIWRAIARRQLSRAAAWERQLALANWAFNDGETDP